MRKCAVFLATALLVFGLAHSANAQTTLDLTREVTGLDANGWLIPGTATLDFTVTIEATGDPGDITALALEEEMPAGWTFNSIVGAPASPPQVGPIAGEDGTFGFAWFAIPATWPLSFTYRVNLPVSEAGPVDVVGRVLYRLAGPELRSDDVTNTIQSEPTILSVARTLDGTTGGEGQFYLPGTTITVNVTLSKSGPQAVTALAFQDVIPAGWTFQSVSGPNTPQLSPAPGSGGPLEFAWFAIPAFPASFSYTLAIPPAASGAATLNGRALYRLAGPELQSNASIFNLSDQPCVSIVRSTVPDGTYAPGQNLVVTIQINSTCAAPITAMAVREVIPAGWTFVSAGGTNPPQLPPAPGAGSPLQFAWFAIPAFPATFTYTVAVPAGQEGDVEISGQALYRLAGPELQSENVVTPLVGDTPPVLFMIPPAEMTVECGDAFDDPGAVAVDVPDGDISGAIVVTGAVDTSTPGVYELTYNVTDSSGNEAIPAIRTVTVEDTTAPEITMNGEANVIVECSGVYADAGATALDTCDGEVEVVVGGDAVNTSVPGEYVITYNAVDGAGNAAIQVTRTVTVVDTIDPVISLIGEANVTVECNDVYVDAGATALDTCDGELDVVVGGDAVDTSAPGVFNITYDAVDSAGNAVQAIRTVTVADTTAPDLTLQGANPLVLQCGTPYVEPGWNVTDSCDPEPDVEVTGWDVIDVNTEGEYTVTYTATDASNNTTVITRTVIVENCVEPCDIASVTVTSPLEGQSFLVQPDDVREVPLSAEVSLTGDCDDAVVVVTYHIGDEDVVSADAENNFAASILLPAGAYTVTATAEIVDTAVSVLSDPVDFIVRLGVDADADGFLDYPFEDLPMDGDSWVSTVQIGDCPRTVVMTTWFGGVDGPDPIQVVIPRADLPEQVLNVSVPRAILAPGEQAVLIVVFACDLPSLLGAEEAALLADDPGLLVNGAAPFEVSIIVTSDGGASFDEIDNALLDAMPISLSLNGLAFNRSLSSSFYAHQSFIDSSEATSGIKLYVDDEGDWSKDAIQNKSTFGNTLAAETTSLSVFHSYAVNPIGPTLSLKPSSEYPLILGIQELNKSITKTITLKNIGGGTLAGTATLAGGDGAFSIVSGGSYSLAEDATSQLVVRFTPKADQAYTATLTFSGGVNSPVVLTLKGTGTTVKLYTLLGCAPGGVSGGSWAGDLLVLTLALGSLMAARRFYRRAHQR